MSGDDDFARDLLILIDARHNHPASATHPAYEDDVYAAKADYNQAYHENEKDDEECEEVEYGSSIDICFH